jgi:rhodanese-related sulfurtransferase
VSSRIIGTAIFVFLGAVLTSVAQEPTGHTKDSLDVVKKNLKDGKAILIDVREQAEWDDGHLKGARLVPLSKLKKKDAGAEELIKLLPKDKAIYVHCASGRRVLVCGEILKQRGFDVRPLKSGYKDLLEAGFEKAAEKK